MDAPESSSWPEWIRYTLSAVAGGVLALIAFVKSWAKVKGDAEDAKKATDNHWPRIAALETFRAEAVARYDGLTDRMDEMRDDLKSILAELRKGHR